MVMKKFMRCAVLFFLCTSFLAACGGGGDSVSVVNNNPRSGVDYYSIKFISPDAIEITLGDNAISFGLMSPADPADVDFVQLRGNGNGWTIDSAAKGVLWKNANGTMTVRITTEVKTDQGNFVVVLKDGKEIWFNGGLFKITSPNNASFDAKTGQFAYAL